MICKLILLNINFNELNRNFRRYAVTFGRRNGIDHDELASAMYHNKMVAGKKYEVKRQTDCFAQLFERTGGGNDVIQVGDIEVVCLDERLEFLFLSKNVNACI